MCLILSPLVKQQNKTLSAFNVPNVCFFSVERLIEEALSLLFFSHSDLLVNTTLFFPTNILNLIFHVCDYNDNNDNSRFL